MTGYLREGGRVLLGDGALLVWSLAEGRRGRRWRALSSRDGVISHSLLLEVDGAGRPSRLELTTEAGMLTLHPEPDERFILGNVVSSDGVRPLAFAWSPEHELEVADRQIATALALHRRQASFPVGTNVRFPVLVVDAGLNVAAAERMVRNDGGDRWTIIDVATSAEWTVTIDADGIPRSDERWPLEP